jgi:ribonucleotide reductase beta subunit family protein with ferritin-like domain
MSNPDRIFPIRNRDLFELHQKQRNVYWVPGKVSFKEDANDFQAECPGNQYAIKCNQGFFSGMDTEIAKYIERVILDDLGHHLEVDIALTFSKMMEHIHQETYERMNETIFTDPQDLVEVNAFWSTNSAIRGLRDWADKLDRTNMSLAECLLISLGIEGIAFPAGFVLIFSYSDTNKFMGMRETNGEINRDENLHVQIGTELYNTYVPADKKVSQERAHELIGGIVEAVRVYLHGILNPPADVGPANLGFSLDEAMSFIEELADNRLKLCGYSEKYHTKSRLRFMDLLELTGKTQMFTRFNPSYTMSSEVYAEESDYSDDD